MRLPWLLPRLASFLALPAAAALGQVPAGVPDAPEPVWAGSVALSYLAVGGNSDTETLGLEVKAERRPAPWGFDLSASFHSAERDGEQSAERTFADLRAKRAVAERWEVFAGASVERDVFADLDLRTIVELGGVHKVLPGPTHALELDLGATWTDEDRLPPEPDRSSLGAILGLSYDWQLSETASLEQRLSYHPNFDRSTDWRAKSQTALTAGLNRRLAVRFSYEHHFRNEPIGDNDDTDTVTRASVVWKI